MSLPEYISVLKSAIFWRNAVRLAKVAEFTGPGKWPESEQEWLSYHRGPCPFCEGLGILDGKSVGEKAIYCLCLYLRERDELQQMSREFGSSFSPENAHDLIPHLTQPPEGCKDLITLLSYLDDWREKPNSWLYIYGARGCGKTTILYNLKQKYWLGPIALYITMPEFQQGIFNRREDTEELDRFLGFVKSVPILLLDDYGLEYGSSHWTTAMIAAVIDHRYTFANLLPVVITSNLPPENLLNSPDLMTTRIGSRLIDGQNSRVFRLRGQDFRAAMQEARARGR